MLRPPKGSRVAVSLIAAVAALLVTGTSAHAQVQACYVPASGTLYLINVPSAPTACRSPQHLQITLATAGPEGPQGPEGPAGPEGPQGPAGAGPLTGLEFFSASVEALPSDGRYFVTCPAGKSVLNFGYQGSLTNPGSVRDNRPARSGGAINWLFVGTPGTAWAFYWVCADANPAVAGTL